MKRKKLKKYLYVALFSALAYVVMLTFRFKISFLTFDLKDAVMAIAGMIFGPVSALIMPLIVSLLEMITVSDTGFYGMLMNYVSSASFCAVAAMIYKNKRTSAGAALALISGCLSMTAVMLAFNMFITPLYTGMATAEVAKLIPKLLLPFNLIKASFNSSVVLLLYKPVSTVLKKTHLIESGENEAYRFGRRTLITLAIALAIMAVSLTVFFVLFRGSVTFGK